MEDTGYIKLYRRITDHPVFDNPKLLKVFIWCLSKATYTERETIVGRQPVVLKPGQFIFGRKSAARELNMNERTVYDYMQLLEKIKCLSLKPTNKFTFVTISNWNKYQTENPMPSHDSASQSQVICDSPNPPSGWIKLYRKVLDNPIIMKDTSHFAVWNYLLLNATHIECDGVFGGKKTTLQPGQLITGCISIAEKLGITESKVRRILKVFEEEGQISRQSSNKNSLITVLNYPLYQGTSSGSRRGSKQYGLGYYRGKNEAIKEIQQQIDELKEILSSLIDSKED